MQLLIVAIATQDAFNAIQTRPQLANHIPFDHPVLAIIAKYGWDETKRILNEQNGH